MRSVDAQARFLILADDLTGACDSAVAFARRGLRVEVQLEGGELPPAEGVWAISTESRDLPEEVAVQRICDSVAMTERAREVFKKVDSVFRGNTFAEIRAAVDCFPCEFAVLCPAYPAMGRRVREGMLHIEDASGARTSPLREGLRRAGLSGFAVARGGESIPETFATMQAAIQAGQKLVLCDAVSEDDLQRTVEAARKLERKILWIGSGGLANALASELPFRQGQQKSKTRDGVVLLFVGSDHAVTQKQLEALRGSAAVLETSIDQFSGVPAECEIVVLAVPREGTTAAQIRHAVAGITQGIACCLMTGGDTAMMVCRALGVRSLLLTEEFAPGLPQGIAMGGSLDGVPVVLKSGGFGKIDVLCDLPSQFVKRKELA